MKWFLVGIIAALVGSIMWSGTGSTHEFHVSSVSDLDTALTLAAATSEDDVIKVQQGTYDKAGFFQFVSDGGYGLSLLGGYTATFLDEDRVVDPANTILMNSTSTVLRIHQRGGGDITVEGFTIEHDFMTSGANPALYAVSNPTSGPGGNITISHNYVRWNITETFGGGIYTESFSEAHTSGTITLTGNTVTLNSGTIGGGVYAWSHTNSGTAGLITLTENILISNSGTAGGGAYLNAHAATGNTGGVRCVNNIVASNNADGFGGGICVFSESEEGVSGPIIFINNTVVGNWSDQTSAGGGVYASVWSVSGTLGPIYFYNNILKYNSGGGPYNDVAIGSAASAYAYNNNIGAATGAWTYETDTININPLFVDSANHDYHLRSASPCIGRGVCGYWTDFPYFHYVRIAPYDDFEGDPRPGAGVVAGCDIGADEYAGIPYRETDFDGDGIPDILWRNRSTGSNALWYMQSSGTSIKAGGGMPSCSVAWHVGGIADFDADGVPDILWRRPASGANALWYMNSGGNSIKSVAGMPSCGTAWQVGGVADFDNDGVPDILWRNPTTGANALWYLQSDGTSIKSVGGMPSCGTTWQPAGVAHFDDDFVPDILWHNEGTGANALWYMEASGHLIKSVAGMPSCAAIWRFGKVADFDIDGVPDILWRNPLSGSNVLWYMENGGSSIESAAGIPSCGTSWWIEG